MYKAFLTALILVFISNFAFGGELFDEYMLQKNQQTLYDVNKPKFDEVGIKTSVSEFFKYIKKGDTKTVKMFLDAGISPNVDFYSTYAIYTAAKANKIEVVVLLLEYGANPNNGFDSPLFCAAKNNNLEMAKILIKHGADVNFKDNFSAKTILQTVLIKKNYDLAQLLIENGAKVDSYSKFLLERATAKGEI